MQIKTQITGFYLKTKKQVTMLKLLKLYINCTNHFSNKNKQNQNIFCYQYLMVLTYQKLEIMKQSYAVEVLLKKNFLKL